MTAGAGTEANGETGALGSATGALPLRS